MSPDKGRKTRDKRSVNSERTPPVKAGESIAGSWLSEITYCTSVSILENIWSSDGAILRWLDVSQCCAGSLVSTG